MHFSLAGALSGAVLFQTALALPSGGALETRGDNSCLKPKVFIISLVSPPKFQ